MKHLSDFNIFNQGDGRALDVAIVVLSCDRYKDLWAPFFDLFFRNWPQCKFPVYLFANKERWSDSRVITIFSGDDKSWSDSIKKCLAQLSHRHVWLLFDDVFLDAAVDERKVERLMNFVYRCDPAYLRFRKYPRPDERLDQFFGRCKEGVLYRTSVFAIWKREVLQNLLASGENAWEFEYKSVQRSLSYPDFYGVYEDYCSYVHGVEKGVWIRDAVSRLQKLNAPVDLSTRRQMTQRQHSIYRRAVVRTNIFNRTPSALKPMLLEGSRIVRQLSNFCRMKSDQ